MKKILIIICIDKELTLELKDISTLELSSTIKKKFTAVLPLQVGYINSKFGKVQTIVSI